MNQPALQSALRVCDLQISHCPFCGSKNLGIRSNMVPWCVDCRTVFMITYARRLRASGKKEEGE